MGSGIKVDIFVIWEVIKYDFASFYCNKVDIFVIWEVIKYEFALFLAIKFIFSDLGGDQV